MKMYIFWLICCATELLAEPINRERTLLIINYNFPHYESVDFLKNLYSPYVDHIVFYGPVASPGVNQMDIHKGYFGYASLADAMEKNPDFDGYLYTNDDCIINYWNFDRFDRDKIWFISPTRFTFCPDLKKSAWKWWNSEWGYNAFAQAYATLPTHYKKQLATLGDNIVLGQTYSDIVYFPAKYRKQVIELCRHFYRYRIFLEIALPTTCACLDDPSNWELFDGVTIWRVTEQCCVEKLYAKHLDYIHPAKISIPQVREFIKNSYEDFRCT